MLVVFTSIVSSIANVASVQTSTAIMGNVPLCIPKRGGPIGFTKGYDFHSGGHTVPMKQYHPYEASGEGLCNEKLPQSSLTSSTSFEEKKRRSLLMGEDTSVVGIEIDQDSVRSGQFGKSMVNASYVLNINSCFTLLELIYRSNSFQNTKL